MSLVTYTLGAVTVLGAVQNVQENTVSVNTQPNPEILAPFVLGPCLDRFPIEGQQASSRGHSAFAQPLLKKPSLKYSGNLLKGRVHSDGVTGLPSFLLVSTQTSSSTDGHVRKCPLR